MRTDLKKLTSREYWFLKDLLRKYGQEICPESKYTGVITGVPKESTLGKLLEKFDLD
jgi:hypothetical protein